MISLFLLSSALLCALSSVSVNVNETYSPDSTMVAFTRDNDLWVRNVSDSKERRLTYDGSELVLNGYASWVYYEEIFGRESKYRAFWWSPDSKKLAFYRFDNTRVRMFPIYSPAGQYGTLSLTRYPKAGTDNPSVRIGIVDLGCGEITVSAAAPIVWADFDECADQYFGTPFWSDDSSHLYVQWMSRRQNHLELYRVSASDGRGESVYHEEYTTWINWITGMLFGKDGLYMARDFRTGWSQIYYLSYDGKDFRALTEGENWSVSLLKLDEKKKALWFSAKRDSRIHPSLYRLDLKRGRITTLTDPDYYVSDIRFSADSKYFTARLSNARTPWCDVKGNSFLSGTPLTSTAAPVSEPHPVPEIVRIQNEGFDLYGLMSRPKDFDPSRRYPVVMQLYGGPGSPYVRDWWKNRDASDSWCWENGIIYIVVDPRSSGENGRRGMDMAFRQMTVIELQDYLAWAEWLGALPYVDASRIGVEGFSFGGTTTAMLVLRYPEHFRCGVAGGGVYDWTLYDTHYTERFMDTPQANPDGYRRAAVLDYLNTHDLDPSYFGPGKPARLKLTHGTGDDNVHFQNTLQLIDALQKKNIQFELMIYPDGMHGYRGAQHEHDKASDALFWTRNLLSDAAALIWW